MTYNFTDDPSPDLTTFINASSEVELTDGSPQGDFITNEFGGTGVTISIIPPSGWSLSEVEWTPGNGTYEIPDPGVEETYSFSFRVIQGTTEKSGGGIFKIKKAGSGT